MAAVHEKACHQACRETLIKHGHNVWMYRPVSDNEVEISVGVQVAEPFEGKGDVRCMARRDLRLTRCQRCNPWPALLASHQLAQQHTLINHLSTKGLDDDVHDVTVKFVGRAIGVVYWCLAVAADLYWFVNEVVMAKR